MSIMELKKIFIIAGDKSGDTYGGILAHELRHRCHSIEIYSCGGQKLAAHSKQIANLVDHAVTGLVEVLASLPRILKTFNHIVAEIHRIKPNLIVLIDFPDFNLRLAKKLHTAFPIFYYISPQVWAWRQKRIEHIRRYVKIITVIFPFEKEFYKTHGIDALYFGHPLLDIVKKQHPMQQKIITLMPGSRKNEIEKHLPIMLAAASIIQKTLPDYTFRILRPTNIPKNLYKDIDNTTGIINHSYRAIEESAFIICSSGTTTVELAILGIPFVLMYKVNALTWFLAKHLVSVKFAGMVNILAGKEIAKEFLQDAASPEAIASAAIDLLQNPVAYQRMKTDLAAVAQALAPAGAIASYADFIAAQP